MHIRTVSRIIQPRLRLLLLSLIVNKLMIQNPNEAILILAYILPDLSIRITQSGHNDLNNLLIQLRIST